MTLSTWAETSMNNLGNSHMARRDCLYLHQQMLLCAVNSYSKIKPPVYSLTREALKCSKSLFLIHTLTITKNLRYQINMSRTSLKILTFTLNLQKKNRKWTNVLAAEGPSPLLIVPAPLIAERSWLKEEMLKAILLLHIMLQSVMFRVSLSRK